MNDFEKFKIALENYRENYSEYNMPLVDFNFVSEETYNKYKNNVIFAKEGGYRHKLLGGEKWVISRKRNLTEKTFEVLRLEKDKSIIRLFKENNDYCEYDLKDESCYTIKKQKNGKVVRRNVKNLNSFLKGYKIHNIYTDNNVYKNFLKKIKEIETNISSVSSLLNKMKEYQYIEQMLIYPDLEVEFDYRYTSNGTKKINKNTSPRYPISNYDKTFIKFLIKNNIPLSRRIENFYMEHNSNEIDMFKYIIESDIIKKVPLNLKKGDIDINRILNIFNFNLLSEINVQPKAFLNYIKHLVNEEMLDFWESIREVQDYYNMIYRMNNGRKYKNKYPKNLLTVIQITSRNYSRYKQYYDEKLFEKEVNRKGYKRLEYKNDIYSIIRPKETQDIKTEAVQMSNCVASYINHVMNGRTKILFLRKNDDIENSLVTIEVNNDGELMQAYGPCNSRPKSEELKFIKEWINEKGIENKTRWSV